MGTDSILRPWERELFPGCRRAWAVLSGDYRPRPRRDFEEGRLGPVWGYVPHRPDHTHVRLNPPEPAGPAGP